MKKVIFYILMLSLIILYGCTSEFDNGVIQLEELDEKYGATLKSPPETLGQIELLLTDINNFNTGVPSLNNFVDFKVKFLEAEKINLEGWQWGRGSTTTYGFGCNKGYARVKEATRLRNMSAQLGFVAVDALESFVENYPEEAKSLNLTQKDVLVLNAMYFQVEEEALSDAKIIESACGGKNISGVYNAT